MNLFSDATIWQARAHVAEVLREEVELDNEACIDLCYDMLEAFGVKYEPDNFADLCYGYGVVSNRDMNI